MTSGDLPTQAPGTPHPGPQPSVLPPLDPSNAPLPVQRIGPYHLVEILGEGGMGTVYRAEQSVPIKRTVALKLIKPGHGSREVIARFEAERQALARLDHPNIAKVLDAGTTDQGQPYFVMEYVPGQPITSFCDEHQLSIPDRLELFTHVCDAIAHAHGKALIHRDIKAGNVLAYMADGKPTVKVIDFGIAKALGGEQLLGETLATASGIAIGTPYAMSPEQANGSLDIDTRTDVYSLGVLLYELLTGRKPFTEKDFASAAYGEILRIIREVEPPRPSLALLSLGNTATGTATDRATKLGSLTKTLRNELEWIPLKAMRKDRTRRYASPLLLAEDVRNYLEGKPLSAGPESRIYRLKKFTKRNRTAVLTSATFAAVLVISTALYIHNIKAEQAKTVAALAEVGRQKQEVMLQRDEARRQEEEAKSQTAIAEAVAKFQTDMLATADPDRLLGDKVTVLQAITAATTELDAKDRVSPPLVDAGIRTTIGTTLRSLARYPEAEASFRKAIYLISGGNNAPTSRSWEMLLAARTGLAGALKDMGKWPQSEALYRSLLAEARNHFPAGDPNIGSCLNDLAEVLRAQRKDDLAKPLYRESLEIYRALLPRSALLYAVTQSNLALILNHEGSLQEADKLAGEALATFRFLLPPNHPYVASTLSNLAGIKRKQRKSVEAETLYQQALDVDRRTLPATHMNIALDLCNLAGTQEDQGKFTVAEQNYRAALSIHHAGGYEGSFNAAVCMSNLAKLLFTENKVDEAILLTAKSADIFHKLGHPAEGGVLDMQGKILRQQHRLPEAEASFRAALEVRRKSLQSQPVDVADSLDELGLTLKKEGKLTEAETLYKEALSIRKALTPLPNAGLTTSLTNLGVLLDAEGKYSEAEPLLSDSLAMQRQLLKPDDAELAWADTDLAGVLLKLHKYDQAAPLYRESLTICEHALGATAARTCRSAFLLAEILERQNKREDAQSIRKKYRLGDPATHPSSRPSTQSASAPAR